MKKAARLRQTEIHLVDDPSEETAAADPQTMWLCSSLEGKLVNCDRAQQSVPDIGARASVSRSDI
jgi:hypothetical protein